MSEGAAEFLLDGGDGDGGLEGLDRVLEHRELVQRRLREDVRTDAHHLPSLDVRRAQFLDDYPRVPGERAIVPRELRGAAGDGQRGDAREEGHGQAEELGPSLLQRAALLIPEGLDGGLVVDEREALLVDRDGPAAVHLRASLGDEGLLDVGSLDAAHADRLAHLHHRDRGVARNLANLGDVHDPAHPRARRRGSASTPMARGTGGVVDPEGSRDGGARGARRGKTRPDAGDVHGRRHVAFVRLCECRWARAALALFVAV